MNTRKEKTMRKQLLVAALLATTMGLQHAPALADVNIHISLDQPRAVAYHPVYDQDYFYDAAFLPALLFVPQLGFYVSVGQPFDMLFINNYYYITHGKRWYRSRHHYGPWKSVRYKRLPRAIRKHAWHTIRYYGDREYRRHDRHRWLKHRHMIRKAHRKSIRESAYYYDDDRLRKHPRKAYRQRLERERRKAYREGRRDERRSYRIRQEKEQRRAYREKERKVRRRNSGEHIIVHEKTTKTRHWRKQDDSQRRDNRWAERRSDRRRDRETVHSKRPRGERKAREKAIERERETSFWKREYVAR